MAARCLPYRAHLSNPSMYRWSIQCGRGQYLRTDLGQSSDVAKTVVNEFCPIFGKASGPDSPLRQNLPFQESPFLEARPNHAVEDIIIFFVTTCSCISLPQPSPSKSAGSSDWESIEVFCFRARDITNSKIVRIYSWSSTPIIALTP